jgi:hypothetical protein
MLAASPLVPLTAEQQTRLAAMHSLALLLLLLLLLLHQPPC